MSNFKPRFGGLILYALCFYRFGDATGGRSWSSLIGVLPAFCKNTTSIRATRKPRAMRMVFDGLLSVIAPTHTRQEWQNRAVLWSRDSAATLSCVRRGHPLVRYSAGGAALVPRSIRLGNFCSCFGSLGEAIIIGGNTEHRLLGRFVVHLIREGARFFCALPPMPRIVDEGCCHGVIGDADATCRKIGAAARESSQTWAAAALREP